MIDLLISTVFIVLRIVRLFSSSLVFIVSVDRCKQVKDFALNVIGNLRFFIAVIRKIAHGAADCFPFCISKEFGDRAKIGGCFVHDCIIADLRGICKRGCATSPTGFQSSSSISSSSTRLRLTSSHFTPSKVVAPSSKLRRTKS